MARLSLRAIANESRRRRRRRLPKLSAAPPAGQPARHVPPSAGLMVNSFPRRASGIPGSPPKMDSGWLAGWLVSESAALAAVIETIDGCSRAARGLESGSRRAAA